MPNQNLERLKRSRETILEGVERRLPLKTGQALGQSVRTYLGIVTKLK
jgi:hypothetical protein